MSVHVVSVDGKGHADTVVSNLHCEESSSFRDEPITQSGFPGFPRLPCSLLECIDRQTMDLYRATDIRT